MKHYSIIALIMLMYGQLECMEQKVVEVLPKQKNALRVMTYNIRRKGPEKTEARSWQNRLPLVVALIKKIQPDVMGLQEALEDQIADLRSALPNFSEFGDTRGSSWWGLAANEGTPIFYDKKRLTLIEHNTFSINKTGGYWMPWDVQKTGWLPRICTWGKFKDQATEQEFYLYNTHLDHQFAAAQIEGAKIIMQHIIDIPDNEQAKKLPVIVTGDFNTEFTGDIKDVFTNFVHVKDLVKEKIGPHETSTGWDSKTLKWIDHILINRSDDIDVVAYYVIDTPGEYPSDHRPVVADIVFKK